MLDGKDRASGQGDAGVGAIEEGDVGLLNALGQALAADGEAVIHGDDLDLAGGQVLHGMVRPMMPLLHLLGAGAEGQGQHLVAEADAEQGDAGLHQLADLRHRVLPGGGRVAGAVRQHHPVRPASQDVLGRGRGGHDGDLRAQGGEGPQDVPLHPEVHDDDVMPVLGRAGIALGPAVEPFLPGEGLAAGGVLGQVQAHQPAPFRRLPAQGVEVEAALRIVGDDRVGHALLADAAGQGPGVHAGQADDAAPGHPAAEIGLRPPVGRRCRGVPENRSAGGGGGVAGHLFEILGIDPDIAYVGEGEGDDLGHVGGIGQDLLVPRHGGVEADLAHGRAGGAAADSLEDGSVREDQDARDAGEEIAHGRLLQGQG